MPALAKLATVLAALSGSEALSLGARPSAPATAGRCSAIRAIAMDAPPTELPTLSDAVPDCPRTIWDADDLDVLDWQKKYKEEDLPACPIEVVASKEANAKGVAYFVERKEEIKAMLEKHGTVWFREFDLMKTEDGFRTFWEALDLDPCLDPLHSSGLRKFLSKRDAVYEEVNKQSLSKHYIGLHNESTNKKSAKAAAFVCFKPATKWGGEFFIADGERILRDMDPEILQMLYDRKVRISAVNLDLDVLDAIPGDGKKKAMDMAEQFVGEKITPKFDMDFELIWGTDGNDMRLQAIEEIQSPINRHPVTGRPAWFCNMHNQARFLRDRRPCAVPEVGMTDIYFGDLSLIPGEVLAHVNEVCEKTIVKVPMQPGDVLLCDNYRVLHGRDIFEGDRLHAVSWFGDEPAEGVEEKSNDVLNNLLNTFLVGK
jgi:hypothetical protein